MKGLASLKLDKMHLSIGLIFVFGVVLFSSIFGINSFGDIGSRNVSEQYLLEGSNRTGSTNIVNSIVWDLRGFDTMGEEIVFFTGAIGVTLAVRSMRKKKKVISKGKKK